MITMWRISMGVVALALNGCVSLETRPEPSHPLPLKEEAFIFMLPPSMEMSGADLTDIFQSPVINVTRGDGRGIALPVATESTQRSLGTIRARLPSNLPHLVVLLVDPHGKVVEAVFHNAYKQPSERYYAAQIRALQFEPSVYQGKAIPALFALDLDAY